MRPSLRHRLLAVLVLAAVACGAALLAILQLASTTYSQRTERASEAVTREVERLRDAAEVGHAMHALRTRRMQSGFLDFNGMDDPPGTFVGPSARRARDEARALAQPSGQVVVREQEIPGGVGRTIVAVGAIRDTGYAWASVRVSEQHGWTPWRVGMLVLALATLGLVALSVATLMVLERGARSLHASLEALTHDLSAPVERPGVRELDSVADGIGALATALTQAHAEHEALTKALAERERLAALGRVAAGVAHEVRNPLAAIKLRVDLARRALSGRDDVVTDLAEVSSEIGRLDRLVADLLMVAGRRTGPRSVRDVGALAAARVALLAPWALERGVNVTVAGSAMAVVDADSVARVLDNLVRNAVEAVAPTDGTLATVRVKVTVEGESAVVAVEDDGPGVPAGRAGELFEPFFTTKSEGTGLGLALSRAVAESHGGTLTYVREQATTRFLVRLPAIDSPPR